jgi:YbbR domain-containing protein
MPFLNFDNPVFFRQRPRGVTGWLRAIFVDDWGLKLLALAITLFLWFAVSGQRTVITVPLRHVPLSFRYASDLELTGEPREVEVTVTGSKQALDHLNNSEMVAVVDISNLKPGERVVQLNRTNFTMNLPDGIRLDQIEPKVIPIRLEPRVEKQVPVAPKFVGKPAPGFEVRGFDVDPPAIQVRGAASRVGVLVQAETEPLSVDGLTADREFKQAAVVLADQKLSLIDTVVNVTVHIGEERIERTLSGVKVVGANGFVPRQNAATIVVFGDKSAVDSLRVGDLVLELSAGGSAAKRLIMAEALTGRIELKSTNPSTF